MAARRTLELKTKQRQELEEYRAHDARPYLRERCGTLLLKLYRLMHVAMLPAAISPPGEPVAGRNV
jgi:hypothetical protein